MNQAAATRLLETGCRPVAGFQPGGIAGEAGEFRSAGVDAAPDLPQGGLFFLKPGKQGVDSALAFGGIFGRLCGKLPGFGEVAGDFLDLGSGGGEGIHVRFHPAGSGGSLVLQSDGPGIPGGAEPVTLLVLDF